METHWEETEGMSKEAMDRWKTGLGETRDNGSGRKSTDSRRVEEGGVGGDKNSWRVVSVVFVRKKSKVLCRF